MNSPENTAQHAANPDVPVFDAGVLGAMFGNESAVIASVLQTFVAGARSNLAELGQAFAAQDLATAAALAHKIAGACHMSGALALGHAARGVEQAAKQGDVTAIQHGLRDLHTQWHLAQVAIGDPAVPPK